MQKKTKRGEKGGIGDSATQRHSRNKNWREKKEKEKIHGRRIKTGKGAEKNLSYNLPNAQPSQAIGRHGRRTIAWRLGGGRGGSKVKKKRKGRGTKKESAIG